MPRRAIRRTRRLRLSVLPEAKRLIDFANAETELTDDDAAIRENFRNWLHRLAVGEQLPPDVIHAPYELSPATVGGQWRSVFEWFAFRRGLEWLAKEGTTLLRECPNCGAFFLIEPGGRRTRKLCPDCTR